MKYILTLLAFTFIYASSENKNATEGASTALPKGRFILQDAQCAGLEFIGGKKIIWRNEITCMQPDTFFLHWVDAKSFLMKDQKSPIGNPDCPPRNWFYTIRKFDGKILEVEKVWTGWGPYESEIERFYKQE
jgi:hypothetical protein